MTPLTQTPEWQALAAQRDTLAGRHLKQFFADDPQRFARFSFRCGGLLADFSKQRLTAETLTRLVRLAEARDLAGFLRRMAAGEAINATENRAALHIALRAEKPCRIGGRDVLPEVRATRAHMRELSEAIRAGAWRGSSGKPINAVVNLGIGGSDLGPRMAVQALREFADPQITIRFVANIDPAEFADTTRDLDHVPMLEGILAQVNSLLPTYPVGKPLPRGLGEIAIPMGDATFRRSALPYTLWMAQRVQDNFRALPAAERDLVGDWIRQQGGARLLDMQLPRLRMAGLRVALDA